MNSLKKTVIALMMVFTLVSPTILPIASNAVVVEAATAAGKINKKALTLETGKTATLSISGTKSKVTWSSDNKKVATVNTKGKVTAVATGTAKITAKVGSKKYTCTVTVTIPANPYLKDVEFDAVEVAIDQVNLVVPKDWSFSATEYDEGSFMGILQPKGLNSNINYNVIKTGEAAPSYDEVKAEWTAQMTQEFIESKFALAGYTDVVIADFTSSDYDSPNGTAYVTSYVLTLNGVTMNQVIYSIFLDNYYVEVTSSDAENLELPALAEFTIDSMRVIK